MSFSTCYYVTESTAQGFDSLDSAVRWALEAHDPSADEDNEGVGVYIDGEDDRVALVTAEYVVVNAGFGTERWPDGFNPRP